MSYLKSYADGLNWADRYSHRGGETSTLTRTVRREYFRDAYEEFHAEIVRGWPDGYGHTRRRYEIAVANSTLDLPESFLSLEVLRRSDGGRYSKMRRTTPRRAEQMGWYDDESLPSGQGRYFIEGPGVEFDTGLQQEVKYPQRIRFFPDLSAGTVVTISYKSQASTLGDPADDDDDQVLVDFIAYPGFAWCANRVRIGMAARAERAELLRAEIAASELVAGLATLRGRQDAHGVLEPNDFDVAAYGRRPGY